VSPLPAGKGGVIESEGDFVPLAHLLCSPSPKFGGGDQGEGAKSPLQNIKLCQISNCVRSLNLFNLCHLCAIPMVVAPYGYPKRELLSEVFNAETSVQDR